MVIVPEQHNSYGNYNSILLDIKLDIFYHLHSESF